MVSSQSGASNTRSNREHDSASLTKKKSSDDEDPPHRLMPDVCDTIPTKAQSPGSQRSEKQSPCRRRRSRPGVAVTFLNHNYFPDDHDFGTLMQAAEDAIDAGVYPERIIQGSSGSYFVKNAKEEIIGVFKPKDEEPYGVRNPKWGKYIQRTFCPCCFGRGCLVMNQGYLSEAGAALVDQKLQLNVVPPTKVVRLSAPTFNYSKIDRAKADSKRRIMDRYPNIGRRFHRIGLPPKTGSFQRFVRGYKDATCHISQFDDDHEDVPELARKEFQWQFERLVMLDYITRNTDRGNDNWLIRYDPEASAPTDETSNTFEKPGIVKIAAIDNGLAFPFKHPDEWRLYPFGWASLNQARKPFSEETKKTMLPCLEDLEFVMELCDDLKKLCMVDQGFETKIFENQMAVMRGQILNLSHALRDGKSPLQLVQMPPMIIERRNETALAAQRVPLGSRTKARLRWDQFRQTLTNRAPFFTCC